MLSETWMGRLWNVIAHQMLLVSRVSSLTKKIQITPVIIYMDEQLIILRLLRNFSLHG